MRIGMVAIIIATVLGLVAATALTVDILQQGAGLGTLEGKITIGPWTPVEPPGGSHPPPEVYTSRKIVIEAAFQRVEIPMNGTGYFKASVKAGTYKLTMTNCTFLGCSRVFPMEVRVEPSQITRLQISVDTGIR